MPRSQVSSGFFRIQMLVVVGLGVLSALATGQLIRQQLAGCLLPCNTSRFSHLHRNRSFGILRFGNVGAGTTQSGHGNRPPDQYHLAVFSY